MQPDSPAPNAFADAKLWIAIAALIQPWLIGLWNRFVRRGRLHVYPTGNIELGYSNFGHMIGLRGTVNATQRDVFIRSAQLLVTRIKDNAQLQLVWLLSRPTTINLDGSAISTAELAASFLLKKTDPASYNVLFTQQEFATDHTAAFQSFAKEWNEYLASHPAGASISRSQQYDEFRKQTGSVTRLWSELNNTFFWRAGAYHLQFSILTEKPVPVFKTDWSFFLTEEDSESLRMNVLSVLEHVAGLPVSWTFAYPKYEKGNIATSHSP